MKQHPNDQRIEPDGPAFHLFGDPALDVYKPKVGLEDIKKMDLEITITQVKPGEKFTVSVTSIDLSTNNILNGSITKISFEGTVKQGKTATFQAPKTDGEYLVTIQITNPSYRSLNAKTWIQVGDGTTKESSDSVKKLDIIFILVFIAILIIIVIFVISIAIRKERKKT